MVQDAVGQSVTMVGEFGYLFVATANADGVLHLATARDASFNGSDHVAVAEWFCPETMANVSENRQISLVVWDPAQDRGYQMLGEVEEVRDLAVLDGQVSPEVEKRSPAQIQRALVVRVDRVLAFTQASHTDRVI
jgi:hypothetical protein